MEIESIIVYSFWALELWVPRAEGYTYRLDEANSYKMLATGDLTLDLALAENAVVVLLRALQRPVGLS